MAMNSVSSEAPSTISGVDMGRKMSRFVAAAARNEWRTRASADEHPEGRGDDASRGWR